MSENTQETASFDWQKKFINEFDKESDRAAVILSVSMIDNFLAKLLKATLVPNPTSTDPLFDGPVAPLNSFHAKTNFAFRLGIISHQFSRDLHLVRRMRNDFSHNIESRSFDDQATYARIQELLGSIKGIQHISEKVMGPLKTKADFLFVVSWMLMVIEKLRREAKSFEVCKLELGYGHADFENIPQLQPIRTRDDEED